MGYNRPVIGVMPLWDENRDSLWMLPGYLEGIREAGGLPVIFPFTRDEGEIRQLASLADGFLFTGGDDVSPEMYREQPLEGITFSCEKRDALEKIALDIALEADKPVLGICRGLQFINAALGGSLYQDIPTQFPSSVNHHQGMPYHQPIHEVALDESMPLAQWLGAKTMAVNSLHHQGVKALAKGLAPMAIAADGLIEAVCMPGRRFVWAVQWHPEFAYQTDPNNRKIFEAFIKAHL